MGSCRWVQIKPLDERWIRFEIGPWNLVRIPVRAGIQLLELSRRVVAFARLPREFALMFPLFVCDHNFLLSGNQFLHSLKFSTLSNSSAIVVYRILYERNVSPKMKPNNVNLPLLLEQIDSL